MPPDREKELREWEKLNKKKAKKLESKPQLLEFQRHLVKCFLNLSRRRQFGMSELPLSVESIIAYGDRFGFKKEGDFFFRCMSDMDDEFLKFQAKKRESERENPPKPERRQSNGKNRKA